MPVIRKALKLVLAYNLTQHITMVEQQGSEQQGSETQLDGQIDDEDSKYFGKVVAPVMINFQIKCAMADMWRELQKDILEELSSLYTSVYSGERLKNWPTIFMLATILLAVWEEMQFDCHYRVPDPPPSRSSAATWRPPPSASSSACSTPSPRSSPPSPSGTAGSTASCSTTTPPSARPCPKCGVTSSSTVSFALAAPAHSTRPY